QQTREVANWRPGSLARCRSRHRKVYRSVDAGAVLNCGGVFAAASLDLDVDVHQGNGCRSNPGNTAGVAQGSRANFDEFFLHLAGESADRVVIEPLRDTALLGFFQPFDGALLLLEL